MFEPNVKFDNATVFSRFDEGHSLSTAYRSIFLENQNWPSSEHYVATMQAASPLLRGKILAAASGQEAYNLIKPWYRPKIRQWKTSRRVYMTRALYTQAQMYPEVCEYLLDTGDRLIAESSAYDHYWGIGRDQRGENMLGQVWMDVRNKMREKARSVNS